MGDWGPGNFQQDHALDFMWREVQRPLLRQIEQMLDDHDLAQADEPTSGPIMAAVELLSILSEHANAVPPKPDDVALWRKTFLESWDETSEEVYFRKEDVTARRNVIVETFDRLAAISSQFHAESA